MPYRSPLVTLVALAACLLVVGFAAAATGPATTSTPTAGNRTSATATSSGFRWAGRSFRRAEDLRRYVERRGGDWERFLRRHGDVVRAFGLGRVRWRGGAFYSRAGLERSLRAHGVSFRAWANAHPRGAALLQRNRRATATAAGASRRPSATRDSGARAGSGARNAVALGPRGFGVALNNPEYHDAGTRDRLLDEVAAAGAGWVRFDVKWSDVQWHGPSSFDWSKYDPLVAAASARGLKVLANLAYSPSWARAPGTTDKQAPRTPVHRSAYARFTAEAVRHFRGRVGHFELWNEPNNPIFWRPSPNAADYAALVRAAYPRMKAVDGGVTVLAGATAPAATAGGWIDEVAFLQGFYAAGGAGSFDAWSHHPYEFILGPGSTHPQSAWNQMFGSQPSLRSLMQANGDGAKPIWGTESGPPSSGSLNGFTFTEEHQAQQIARGFSLWRSYPWAGVLFTYTGRDDALYGAETSYWAFLGLLRHDFSRKPGWHAFRAAAA